MCKYCKDGDRPTFEMTGDGDGFSISGFLYPKEKELAALILYHDEYVFEKELKIAINYCPMCGRKLSE